MPLRNERMVLGESVFKFEEEFARYIGTEHAISVSSGPTRCILTLMACNVQGREVITTPFSFVATANAIVQAGCDPHLCDVSERTTISIPKS